MLVLISSVMLNPQVWTRPNFAANEWNSLDIATRAFSVSSFKRNVPKQLLTYPQMSYFLVFLLNIIVLFVLFTHLYHFKFIDSVVSSIVFSANCFKSPVRCETLPYCHSALSAVKGVIECRAIQKQCQKTNYLVVSNFQTALKLILDNRWSQRMKTY